MIAQHCIMAMPALRTSENTQLIQNLVLNWLLQNRSALTIMRNRYAACLDDIPEIRKSTQQI